MYNELVQEVRSPSALGLSKHMMSVAWPEMGQTIFIDAKDQARRLKTQKPLPD